jgi:bacterial/archaeal transporter family-2 protein
MKIWMGGLAIVIGALLPVEALLNARLAQVTRGPLFAAFVTCIVGAAALGSVLFATRAFTPVPGPGSAPPWIWLGGLLGATYLASATMLVPRLGAAALICLVILGQVLSSLLLDHYGVLNSVRPADPVRVLGAVLVAAGALLVARPWQAA